MAWKTSKTGQIIWYMDRTYPVVPTPRRPRFVAALNRFGVNWGHVAWGGGLALSAGDRSVVAMNDCPALVLNADFRPLSYFPLSLWSWQNAVKAVFLERVYIISEYEREVRSPGVCDAPAERDRAQALHPDVAPAGVHPLQRVPARPFRVPVLRHRAGHAGAYLRSRRSAVARRADELGQRRERMHGVQPAQGQPAAA